MYLGWYGLGRMFIEGLRTDSLYGGSSNLRVSQLVAGICFLGVVIFLVYDKIFREHDPADLYVNQVARQKAAAEAVPETAEAAEEAVPGTAEATAEPASEAAEALESGEEAAEASTAEERETGAEDNEAPEQTESDTQSEESSEE